MLRKWISLMVMLAFVVTTMPSISHAALSSTKNEKTAAVAQPQKAHDHHDCHSKRQKTAASNQPSSAKKHCCDGVQCKCLGNACNGAAKVLGAVGLNVLPEILAANHFDISTETIAFNHDGRIKRPPRA